MSLVGNSHLIAGPLSAVEQLADFLRSEHIELAGNPDAYVRTYAHFGVDDARELRERANLSARGERRIFVVAATVITPEAQNALLKTLEEPPGDAYFFLIVPAPETLLATLRSRMQRLDVGSASGGVVDASAFLRAIPEARLELLKPILEKGDDERRDISGAVMLLESLERTLSGRYSDASAREGLNAIYRARKYMGDKGSLLKPLLEHVALLVPRVGA